MKRSSIFIVSLNWIDVLTLCGLLIACIGLVYAFQGSLSLSIGIMLIAMLVDMFDGVLARRFKLEREFGRFLDSFCDVFIYLVLPLFILYQLGMQDLISLMAIFSFLTGGVLRLSHFNIIGTVKEKGTAYHIGLQVIWSHLLVVLAFPLFFWFGESAKGGIIILLIGMSVFMISNTRFPKPVWYKMQTSIILSVATIYIFLHFIGLHEP